MSKLDKTLKRLRSKPKDFRWQDVEYIFSKLGFTKIEGDGARVKFRDEEKDLIANFHKPHPDPVLKHYAVKQMLDFLIENGYIENE